jgi:hypothetical protein
MADIFDRASEHTRLNYRHPFPASAEGTDNWAALSRSEWLRNVRQRLRALADMPAGWDGYGAPRIPTETTLFALQVLQDIYTRRLPPPDISAMSSGGIMIEWVNNNTELTVEVLGPYSTSYVMEVAGQQAAAGEVGSDTSELQKRAAQLAPPILLQLVG